MVFLGDFLIFKIVPQFIKSSELEFIFNLIYVMAVYS